MRSGGAGAARGLRDGTVSLLSALVLESMNLTTRLAQSAQGLLEIVDDAVSRHLGGPSAASADGLLSDPSPRMPGESMHQYALRLEHQFSQLQRNLGRHRPQQLGQQQQQQQRPSAIPFLDGDSANLRDQADPAVRWSKMANQPANFQEGLEQAYAYLYQGGLPNCLFVL